MVVFVAVAMIASGAMKVHGLALNGTGLPWFSLLWLGANVFVGLNEEYLFRGYALRVLWRGAEFWPAALVTTAIFAGLHLSKPHERQSRAGLFGVKVSAKSTPSSNSKESRPGTGTLAGDGPACNASLPPKTDHGHGAHGLSRWRCWAA